MPVVVADEGNGDVRQLLRRVTGGILVGEAPGGELRQKVLDGLVVFVGLGVAGQGVAGAFRIAEGKVPDSKNLEFLTDGLPVGFALCVSGREAFLGLHGLGRVENRLKFGLGGGLGRFKGVVALEGEREPSVPVDGDASAQGRP